MIRKLRLRSFAGIVAMLSLTVLSAGCGFKGPLYLPPPKPAKSTQSTPAPATPVPATPAPAPGTTP